MPLQWTTIDLPWAGGIDAKRHPYLRELPKATSLVNMRFQQSGALVARGGVTNLGGPSQDPDAVWTWRGTMAQTQESTYLLDQPGGNWRELGFTGPRAIEVAQRAILRTQEGASTVACGVANSHALYAWTKSPDAEVYVVVRNLETGVTVYGPTTVAGLDVTAPYASSLRAATHENDYVTVFASGGGANVNGVTFSISAAGSVTVGTATAFTGTGSDHYEVHTEPNNSQVYLVTDNGANLRLVRLTRSGLALSVQSAATLSSAGSLTSPLGVCLNSAAGIAIAVSTSGSGGGGNVECWVTPAGVSLPGSIARLWTETPGATDPSVFDFFRFAPRAAGSTLLLCEGRSTASPYDLTSSPPGNIPTTAAPSGVWSIELDNAGAQTPGDTLWNVYMACSPVEFSGAVHVLFAAPDVVQNETSQSINDWVSGVYSGTPPEYMWSRAWATRRVGYLARYGTDGAKPRRIAECGHDVIAFTTPVSPVVRNSLSALPSLHVSGTELVTAAATVEISSQPGTLRTTIWSNPAFKSLREYRFAYGKALGVGEAQGLSVLGSGYLAVMDGDRVGEITMGPPQFVDLWVDGTTASVPTLTVAGSTIEWRACWEWRDALGRLHYSAPSAALAYTAITLAGGSSGIPGFSARVVIPPFIDAEVKDGCLPKDVRLVVYASPQFRSGSVIFNADDSFWAYTPTYGVALEDIRDASYPWMSTRFDFEVLASETTRPLYTNGGILENDVPPSPLHLVATRERVWIIDSENRDRAYFSQPLSSPEAPPEFSAALYLSIPTEAGELVALGVLDDLVVFFSESSIHALSTADAGPDSTGAGDWPPLRRFSREVGCVNAASVVTTDVGLFFASAAGIYLLAPTGQLTWVGRDLGDDFDPTSIVSSTVVPERKEVVFASANGCYVFDYDHAQWTATIYTGDDGPTVGSADIAAATGYGGELVLTSTAGLSWQEDSASQEQVIYQVRTGWIHLAGLQGFQRIRRFGLLGRIGFDPALPSTFESPANLGTLTIRAFYDYDDTSFDDYSIDLFDVYSQLDPMRLRMRLACQQCESISFRVTVSVVGQQQVYSPRPELAGLALEVGAKKRLYPWAHALGSTSTGNGGGGDGHGHGPGHGPGPGGGG